MATQRAPSAPTEAIPPTDMPDDSAEWAALAAELGEEDAEPAEEPDSEPAQAADAPTEEPDSEPATKKPTYDEIARNYKNTTAALREARAREKVTQEQMRELLSRFSETRRQPERREPEAPKAPARDEDPIGYFEHRNAVLEHRLNQLERGSRTGIQQLAQQQEEQRFWNHVIATENQIRKEKPDYDDACRHLETSRRNHLAVLYPDESPQVQAYAAQHNMTPTQLREAMLNEDRRGVATQAVQQGRSPAELYYELAVKMAGWQAPANGAAPGKVKVTDKAIDAARRGQKAAKSLGGSGGKTDNPLSVNDLADLALEDPEEFDRQWARMEKQGRLG